MQIYLYIIYIIPIGYAVKNARPKRNRVPPFPRDVVERIIESYDNGWPDYEEPFVDVQML
jgi:hypothetical protein